MKEPEKDGLWIAAAVKNGATGTVVISALPADETATQLFMKVKMVP